MAKTNNSVFGTKGYLKVEVTAAMVSALASLTTAEVIDISPIVESIEQTSEEESEIAADHALGDNDPILDVNPNRGVESYQITLFHTRGLEALGTDLIDPYEDIFRAIRENDPTLSVPITWSMGGESGDTEEASSSTETFITGIGKPVSADGKVRVTVSFTTPPTTSSVIA